MIRHGHGSSAPWQYPGAHVKNNVESMLEEMRAALPEELVPPGSWQKLTPGIGPFLRITPKLVLFEIRFARNDPTVDMSFLVSGSDSIGNWIAGSNERVPERGVHPGMRKLQSFFTLWQNTGTLYHQRIKDVWLEFDSAGNESTIRAPGVWIDVRDHCDAQFIVELLSLFHENGLPSPAMRLLRNSIAHVPRDGWIPCIGVLLSREPCELRLTACSHSSQWVRPFLGLLGMDVGENRMRALFALLSCIEESGDDVIVGLQISLYPRIHLAGIDLTTGETQETPRLTNIMGILSTLFPVDEGKRKAFLSWKGMLGCGTKRISHVKLGCPEGKGIVLKGYFGIMQ